MKSKRNSSIELLRILCVYGIVLMHEYAPFFSNSTGKLLTYGVVINSICNMCVTLFMLISGYFGIKGTWRRIISFEISLITFSLINVGVAQIFTGGQGLGAIIKAFMPVSMRTYWYMSVYMIIMCLSGFVNRIPEKLSKEEFEKLLAIMMVFFYLMPTITRNDIMRDSGKGLANMLVVYLIGRYIAKYRDDRISPIKTLCISIAIIGVETFGNLYSTFGRHGGQGVYIPWGHDNSLLILFSAIFLFLTFKNITFHSKAINFIASGAIGVFLFDAKTIVSQFLDISSLSDFGKIAVLLPVDALIITAMGITLEIIRSFIYKKIEAKFVKVN